MESLISKQIIGVNQLADPEQLQDNECTQLDDLVLDNPAGQVVKRDGWSKFNTNAVDTAGDVVSIHDLKDKDGDNYLFAVIGTKLRKSVDGTAAFVDAKTGLTTGKKIRTAAINNGGVVFTNDSDAPFILSGSDFANESTAGITAPVLIENPTASYITGSVSDSQTTGLENNKGYRWCLVYEDEDGNLSNPSRPWFYQTIFTTASNSTDYKNSNHLVGTGGASLTNYIHATFGNLPVSSDPKVVSKRLYRTTGSGDVFYLVKSIDNSETSITDDLPDADLDLTEILVFMNAPEKARYLAKHNGRLFLGYISRKEPNAVAKIAAQLSDESGEQMWRTQNVYTAGSIVDGTYRWKYSFVDKDGIESELSEHYVEQTLADGGLGTTNSIRLQGWSKPFIGAQELDSEVMYIRLYRTWKDTTAPYYYVKDISPVFDGETSGGGYSFTVEDTKIDADIVEVYPKAGKSVTTETTYKTGIMFSEINAYRTFRDESFIEVFPDDGDEITAITDDVDGLLIFKRFSICKLFTTGSPANWQLLRLIKEIGCSEPESLIRNENEYAFVFNNQVFVYQTGAMPVDIGEKFRTFLSTITAWNGGTYIKSRQWYVWAVAVSSQYFVIVYDKKLQTWYKFSGVRVNAVSVKKYGSSAGKLITGSGNSSNANYICYYNSSATVDNTTGSNVDISPTFVTKTYLLGDGLFRGRLRELFLNYNGVVTEELYITITDPDLTTTDQNTFNPTGGWETLRTAIDVWSTKAALLAAKIKIQFSGAGLNKISTWKLNYFLTRRGRGR